MAHILGAVGNTIFVRSMSLFGAASADMGVQWVGTFVPICGCSESQARDDASSHALAVVVEYGRRRVMMIGCACMAVAMAMLAGTTSVVEESVGSRRMAAGWASAAAIYFYYAAFGASNNSIPWLWPPELNSLRTRQRGAGFATANNWLWNFVRVAFHGLQLHEVADPNCRSSSKSPRK